MSHDHRAVLHFDEVMSERWCSKFSGDIESLGDVRGQKVTPEGPAAPSKPHWAKSDTEAQATANSVLTPANVV